MAIPHNASDPHLREILPDEIHVLHPEALPIQMGQRARLRGEFEGQLIRIQRLITAVVALVQLPVLAISQQWMPRVGKLRADLVRSSRDQFTFYQ